MRGSPTNYHDKARKTLNTTLAQNTKGTKSISTFLTTLDYLLKLPENNPLSNYNSQKLAMVLAAINTFIAHPTRSNAKTCLSCATELNTIFTSRDSRIESLSPDARKKEQAIKGTLAILLLGVCIVSAIVAVSLISGGSAGLLDVAVQGLSGIGGDLFGIPFNVFLTGGAAIVSGIASGMCAYRTAVPKTEAKGLADVKSYVTTTFLNAKQSKIKEPAFKSASETYAAEDFTPNAMEYE